MKSMGHVRIAAVLAIVVCMSSLFMPAVGARSVCGDDAAYFSTVQLSEGADEICFTHLPPAQDYDLVTVNTSRCT